MTNARTLNNHGLTAGDRVRLTLLGRTAEGVFVVVGLNPGHTRDNDCVVVERPDGTARMTGVPVRAVSPVDPDTTRHGATATRVATTAFRAWFAERHPSYTVAADYNDTCRATGVPFARAHLTTPDGYDVIATATACTVNGAPAVDVDVRTLDPNGERIGRYTEVVPADTHTVCRAGDTAAWQAARVIARAV